MRLESCDVNGGKLVLVADMHLSARFTGKHKDYLKECYYNLERVKDIVVKEEASAVVFLGDIIGVNERTISDRRFLSHVLNFFVTLNKLMNGNVFAVKGNHDAGDFTDFDLLTSMNLIKNPRYINYYGKKNDSSTVDGLEVRFHLVNYGDEDRALSLSGADGMSSDVVLGHNDYYITGVTNWYSAGSSVEVSKLTNFKGVQLILSGHIHAPSHEVLYTNIENNQVGLFFPGSPGRVSEKYDDCWYLVFEYRKSSSSDHWSTEYQAKPFGLEKAAEVFEVGSDDADEAYEGEAIAEEKTLSLRNIVSEIIDGQIISGDILGQVDLIPGASAEAKAMAKEYLVKAAEL